MLRHKSNHMFYLKIIILISAVLNTTSKEDGYVIMCAFYEKKIQLLLKISTSATKK